MQELKIRVNQVRQYIEIDGIKYAFRLFKFIADRKPFNRPLVFDLRDNNLLVLRFIESNNDSANNWLKDYLSGLDSILRN